MKIVIAGGSGQVGAIVLRALAGPTNECVVLSRHSSPRLATRFGERTVMWDARTVGPWVGEIDGADVVINLAGRSVDCRYTRRNLAMMMRSRVESTRVIGEALRVAKRPPPLWLQASTATIYAHRFDAPNDDFTGVIGGGEQGVPELWNESVKIALAWEEALQSSNTPSTRKVALRTAMVMSSDSGGVFDVLSTLARYGLGGTQGSGRQFVSWIHEADFVGTVRFLMENDRIEGPVNVCAPEPLPNARFLAELRRALGVTFAPPCPAWLLEIGACFLRTETELILKSRRVIPARLLRDGFRFRFSQWPEAVNDLTQR